MEGDDWLSWHLDKSQNFRCLLLICQLWLLFGCAFGNTRDGRRRVVPILTATSRSKGKQTWRTRQRRRPREIFVCQCNLSPRSSRSCKLSSVFKVGALVVIIWKDEFLSLHYESFASIHRKTNSKFSSHYISKFSSEGTYWKFTRCRSRQHWSKAGEWRFIFFKFISYLWEMGAEAPHHTWNLFCIKFKAISARKLHPSLYC